MPMIGLALHRVLSVGMVDSGYRFAQPTALSVQNSRKPFSTVGRAECYRI